VLRFLIATLLPGSRNKEERDQTEKKTEGGVSRQRKPPSGKIRRESSRRKTEGGISLGRYVNQSDWIVEMCTCEAYR